MAGTRLGAHSPRFSAGPSHCQLVCRRGPPHCGAPAPSVMCPGSISAGTVPAPSPVPCGQERHLPSPFSAQTPAAAPPCSHWSLWRAGAGRTVLAEGCGYQRLQLLCSSDPRARTQWERGTARETEGCMQGRPHPHGLGRCPPHQTAMPAATLSSAGTSMCVHARPPGPDPQACPWPQLWVPGLLWAGSAMAMAGLADLVSPGWGGGQSGFKKEGQASGLGADSRGPPHGGGTGRRPM